MTSATRSLKFRKPMLAKNFGTGSKVTYPCFAQPKVDGIRCITDGQRFWSRNGNLFPAANFKHLVVPRFPYLVDCEIAIRNADDFEDVVSIVKRRGHPEHERICLNVFDCILKEPYALRRQILRGLFETYQLRYFSQRWSRLTTRKIHDREELDAFHARVLKLGYEGSIIRLANGLYVSTRTANLLKRKPTMEAEFIIVDVIEARGKDKGTAVFKCKVGDTTFRVRPEGSMKLRRWMWRNRKKLIGEPYTVEFLNYTKYGKPRHPRGKALRNYE